MSVKLYVDLRSQPCRSMALFLKSSDIPFEFECVDLFEGEHKKDKYASRFPLQTVPALQDGEYNLCETMAIFRYLTTKFSGKFKDNWYPAEPKARGRVDEYMAFHHTGIRSVCVGLFVAEVLTPMFTGKATPKEEIAAKKEKLDKNLDTFERAFLKDKDYICGKDISFADLLAVCEFVQFTVNGRDIAAGRPRLKAYIDRVKNKLSPVFDEVHARIYEWRDSYQKK